MYADDNEDKIINGDAEEYGTWGNPPTTPAGGECARGGIHYREKPWVLKDWSRPSEVELTLAQKKDQITKGAFFRFIKDIRVLKCPRGNADEARTYTFVDSMNVKVLSVGSGAELIKNRQQIRKAYERFVFLENGGYLGGAGGAWGGWTAYVSTDKWWDLPSARHGDGTTFSYADGHAEYHKWLDSTTLNDIKNQITDRLRTGNKDIRWTQIGVWGSNVTRGL
jgi:prepilin-type processing-associated H-X9-DG protein